MDYEDYQLWKKEDIDNPFGADIAIFSEYGDIVTFKWFLIEVDGVKYLDPCEDPSWLENHYKFNTFNSWYAGNMKPEIRVNHIAGALSGTGFGQKTGHMLPERFMNP